MNYLSIDSLRWPDTFKLFKERAGRCQAVPKLIDANCTFASQLLNADERYATVFSCEAHPNEKDRQGELTEGSDNGYLMIVTKCREAQSNLIETLHKVNTALWNTIDVGAGFDTEISITFGLKEVALDDNDVYPSITVRTPFFKDIYIRDSWWTFFNNSLKENI